MNERIKELAVEAKLPGYVLEYGTELCLIPHLEKFAELIIQECTGVVLDSDPSPKMVAHEPYRNIMNNIVDHFGISE